MRGKRGLIMGVANRNSIAWGIARTLFQHGADLALTYQGEALERRVRPLAKAVSSDLVMFCDVEDPKSIETVFDTLNSTWGDLDFIVHAIAYSDKEELKGHYIDTSRNNFLRTLDVSCYSFTAIARNAAELMQNGGSLISLSFFGSEKVMPNYNVMGVAKAALEASIRYLAVDLGPRNIRVNGISAGPMRTLAGSAIGGAREILKRSQEAAPLSRALCQEDIGGAALYLLSDLSRSVTGEIHHVDSGFNIVGMTQNVADKIE
ncbi:MAG: enoyl-[acyl-carrier-protein] reductase FabI [Magnetovibrio sp.]|nr:enoyl-[acyl-carrier-protein] reductase FabI [Magnetovibrio sp.]